jgi:hypothetical protein
MGALLTLLKRQRGAAIDPETASAVVSGAGTATVNATHTRSGSQNGKPYFVNGVDSEIIWDNGAGEWWINDGSFGTAYSSGEDVAFPWLVTAWTVVDGDTPAPTVTAG